MQTPSQTQIIADIYQQVERRFLATTDLAHGWEHIQRVYRLALRINQEEEANEFIVGSAALLHDIGRLVRQKGKRHAELSVQEARPLLACYPLDQGQIEAILHAIIAHSFSQGVEPQTLEARIVRDADRLDGLGAIGILRWAITGTVKRKANTRSYHPEDPFATWHQLNDKQYMLDHFYSKLLKLEEGMYTTTGRALAQQRTTYMRGYLEQLKNEIE
jgi:uncharacterized protein